MRTAIALAAIVTFAGTAFAQEGVQPSAPGAIQHPPIHSEPATPPMTAAPKLPDAASVISQEQAKAKIEGEGYTEVSGLKQDDKGMWTATAMKDGKPVQLSLNTEGQVTVRN